MTTLPDSGSPGYSYDGDRGRQGGGLSDSSPNGDQRRIPITVDPQDSAALKFGGNLVENIRNAIGKWSGGSEFVLEMKDVTKSDIKLVEAAFEETGVRGRATINFEDCTYILTWVTHACHQKFVDLFLSIYRELGIMNLKGYADFRGEQNVYFGRAMLQPDGALLSLSDDVSQTQDSLDRKIIKWHGQPLLGCDQSMAIDLDVQAFKLTVKYREFTVDKLRSACSPEKREWRRQAISRGFRAALNTAIQDKSMILDVLSLNRSRFRQFAQAWRDALQIAQEPTTNVNIRALTILHRSLQKVGGPVEEYVGILHDEITALEHERDQLPLQVREKFTEEDARACVGTMEHHAGMVVVDWITGEQMFEGVKTIAVRVQDLVGFNPTLEHAIEFDLEEIGDLFFNSVGLLISTEYTPSLRARDLTTAGLILSLLKRCLGTTGDDATRIRRLHEYGRRTPTMILG
jgi:hypothetical protein